MYLILLKDLLRMGNVLNIYGRLLRMRGVFNVVDRSIAHV